MTDDKSSKENKNPSISEKANENEPKTEKDTKINPVKNEVQLGNNSPFQLNDNMVQKAVQFFQSPKVQSRPVGEQIHFLKSKGLTQEEIDKACQIAGVDVNSSSMPPPSVEQPKTLLQLLSYYSTVTLVVGSVLYAIKWLYSKYIAPFFYKHFTGRQKKLANIDSQVKEMQKGLKEEQNKSDEKQKKIEKEMLLLREKISEIYDLVEPVNKSMSSLKSLILSSQQFPKPPPKQYIPEWQLKPIAAEKKLEKVTDVNADTLKEVKFETTENEISKPEVTEESLNDLQS